jgi:hypothetical protein
MKIAKKMFIVDFVIIILIMIAMVIFPSIMFHTGSLCFSGMLIYNWAYVKRKRKEIKEFYNNYYDNTECADLAEKWSLVVSYGMLLMALFLIIQFVIDLTNV